MDFMGTSSNRKKIKRRKIRYSSVLSLSISLCIGGLFLLYGGSGLVREMQLQYVQGTMPVIHGELRDIPTRVHIPAVNISIGVKQAKIAGETWQTFKDSAAFLSQSAVPGGNGNIVLYGHNTNTIFKQLEDIQLQQLIYITNQSGKIYTYVVTDKNVVDPTAVSYVQPTQEETLTLYTCTGFLDLQRLVVRARPFLDVH